MCVVTMRFFFCFHFHAEFMFAITGATVDNSTTVRYECPQCGRTYKWRSSLKSHLQNECGKEPRCLCPHCPYRCKVRSNLLKHVRNYHKPPPSQTLQQQQQNNNGGSSSSAVYEPSRMVRINNE